MAIDVVAAAAILLFCINQLVTLVLQCMRAGVDAYAVRTAAAEVPTAPDANIEAAAAVGDTTSNTLVAWVVFVVAIGTGVLLTYLTVGTLDSRLEQWHSTTLPGHGTVRYKWMYLGAARDTLVPVVACTHWDLAPRLQEPAAGLVSPLPEVTRDDRHDPARENAIAAQRRHIAEARDTAARRCVVDDTNDMVPLNLNMDHLLSRARLSDWIVGTPYTAAGMMARTHVEHVLVQRDGKRWYPVVAVTPRTMKQRDAPTARTTQYELRPALLDEQLLLVTATAYVDTLMAKSRGGIRLDHKCLCVAHFGVFGSGLHLVYDDRLQPPRWCLWTQVRYVRPQVTSLARTTRASAPEDNSLLTAAVADATRGGALIESNMTYFEYLLQFPAEVDARMQVINSAHHEGEYLAVLDLATRLEAPGIGETHLDAREPQWVNTDLPREHVPPLAAIIALDALFPRDSPLREHQRLLSQRDVMCWAHCRDLERAIMGADPFVDIAK